MLPSALCLVLFAVLPSGSAVFAAGKAAPAHASPESGALSAAAQRRDPFAERLAEIRADAKKHSDAAELMLDLHRAHALKERLPGLAPLAELYSEVIKRASAPSEARALARFLLAEMERTQGRLPKAKIQTHALGMVSDFALLGPFDNEGKGGCDTAYAPEKEIDFSKGYSGKVREVRWRKISNAVDPGGYVDLGSAVRPAKEVAVYALALLDSPREERAVLSVGGSGAFRLWVNGTKSSSSDDYHLPRLDQNSATVTLRPGPNRVLLKLCQAEGPFGFYLRASKPSGAPLDLRTAIPDALPPAPKGASPSPQRLPSPLEALKRKADANPVNGKLRADYAELLTYSRAFDDKTRLNAVEAAKAAKLSPADERVQLVAARAEESDPNLRRAYLEAARAAAPNSPYPASALAADALNRGYPKRAVDLAQPAAEKNPTFFPLQLALIRSAEELGEGAAAFERFGALAARFPDRPEVLREWARELRRVGRVSEATRVLRVVLGLRYDDEEARRALISMLLDEGRLDEALRELDASLALDPSNLDLLARRADLLAANDRGAEAKATYERALKLCPEEADLHEHRGRALLRLGETEPAKLAFERALELKPQNPELKEALRALKGEGSGFGEAYAYDAAKLAHEEAPLPGEDAVFLADLTAVKLFPNGLTSRFRQIVARAQNERGVDGLRAHGISYSPDREDVKIVRARLLKADGSIIEAHGENERSLSEPWSGIYYDARVRTISFPNMAPGDVVELAYRVDDVGRENLLSDYFGDMASIQASYPKRRFDYIVEAPPGRTLYSNPMSLPQVAPKKEKGPQGGALYRWSGKEIPKVVPEPGMPGWGEATAVLHVSTYRDWAQVGRYYTGLVRDQIEPDETVKAATREILAKLPKRDEKSVVKAIYDFVVSKVRYVGLEFGIHGYKPYKVDRILSRSFGDCKDKASLMNAMLKVAGVDSRLVLLRTRQLGRLGTTPASLSAFNHAILYVPSLDWYLDGTAEFYGSSELPEPDRGATALVVNPKGASELRITPDPRADDNQTRAEFQVELKADGSAAISGQSRISGLAAPEYRRAYQSESARKATFERAWSRIYPGLSVKSLELTGLADIESEVGLRFSLEVPRYAESDGSGLSFTPFGAGRGYMEAFAPLSERKFDQVLGYPWISHFRYALRLPAGAAVAELPQPVEIQGPFGRLILKYKQDAGSLVAEGEVALTAPRVAAKDYPAFRAFLSEIDRAQARRVKLTLGSRSSARTGTLSSR